MNTNIMDSAWVLTGLGLRLAQEKGIHRLKCGSARTEENELHLRAFWMLWGLDIQLGNMLGRPLATSIQE